MIAKHMYFICPYRAREGQEFRKNQLQTFLDHMKSYLPTLGHKYTILIIEQNNDLPFNRGMLCNLGYIEAKKLIDPSEENMFCHHNIDMIPTKLNYFSFNNSGFKDICGVVYGLGSIYMFNGGDFEKTNGYPNCFWGWGAEDLALYARVERVGLQIDRSEYNQHLAYEMEHLGEKDTSPNNKNIMLHLYELENELWIHDGLNSLEYTIDSKEFNEQIGYWHYKVDFEFKQLEF